MVQPWWNPRGTLPQGRPGPPRSLSGLRPQSFRLLGNRAPCKGQGKLVTSADVPKGVIAQGQLRTCCSLEDGFRNFMLNPDEYATHNI